MVRRGLRLVHRHVLGLGDGGLGPQQVRRHDVVPVLGLVSAAVAVERIQEHAAEVIVAHIRGDVVDVAVLVRFRRIVPAVAVAFLGEGQAGHELVGADVRRVILDGAGGAGRRGAVLLVGHVVEAIRHVREGLGVAAVGVVQEHRAVRVVGLGADVLGQGADHVIGDRHIRIGGIGLHVDIQAVQANRRHVLVDDLKRIDVVVGVGGVIDRLAQIGHIVAEAFDGDLFVVDAADELDTARMQVRGVLGLELVVERLGLRFLAGRHITEHVDHIHAVRDVIHRDPVLILQIRIHTLHRHITPRTVVHHEVSAVRVRDGADGRGGFSGAGRRRLCYDTPHDGKRHCGDTGRRGGKAAFQRPTAEEERMVCDHRCPFSILEGAGTSCTHRGGVMPVPTLSAWRRRPRRA